MRFTEIARTLCMPCMRKMLAVLLEPPASAIAPPMSEVVKHPFQGPSDRLAAE